MIVRLAKLTDISDTLAFVKRKLTEGNYADFPFNAVIARRTMRDAMTSPTSRVWVAVDGSKVVGILVGEAYPMPFTHYMCATDTCFLADKGGEKLLAAFLAWCKLLKVARVDMGVSSGESRKGVDRLFRRHGLTRSGGMYHMNALGDST